MSVYLSQSCLILQEWAHHAQLLTKSILEEQGLNLKVMGMSVTLITGTDPSGGILMVDNVISMNMHVNYLLFISLSGTCRCVGGRVGGKECSSIYEG